MPDHDHNEMIRDKAVLNLKRVINWNRKIWVSDESQSPYMIMDTQEIKTTWHPIENVGGAKAGY